MDVSTVVYLHDWPNLIPDEIHLENNKRLYPRSFHATNIALHCLATYLLVIFSRQVLRTRTSSSLAVWVTGLLFALHPVHVEAVAGIVGRADILAGIFFLIALIFHQKHIAAKKYHDESLKKYTHQRYYVNPNCKEDKNYFEENENNNNYVNIECFSHDLSRKRSKSPRMVQVSRCYCCIII